MNSTTNGQSRIQHLDTFRYLTVTFALVSHALLAFNFRHLIDQETWSNIRLLTRSATPSLLFLFGIMAEIVYFPRYQSSAYDTKARLITRSIQCYLAFLSLGFFGVIIGINDIRYFIMAIGFMADMKFATIFAMYSFFLISLIVLLKIRTKFGLIGIHLLLILVWIFDALIINGSSPLPKLIKHLPGMLIGWGEGWGPSIIHGLTMVVFGILCGNVMFSPNKERPALFLLLMTIGIAASILYIEVSNIGISLFIKNIGENLPYRSTNSPIYFSYGILASIVLVAIAKMISLITPLKMMRAINSIGSKTFSYYFIGNMILLTILTLNTKNLMIGVYGAAIAIIISGYLTIKFAEFSKGCEFCRISKGFVIRMGIRAVGLISQRT